MELELTRVDYCAVGTSLPNCLKLLPSSKSKEPQKVAVGDQDGVLQVFSLKKDEIQIAFKTLPSEKVSALQLAGATGTLPDKIFVAHFNKVRGFNKKGKLFLSFDTNMTESIKSMFVAGNDLIVCGNHLYNHYKDCKDIGSYLCGDTIVDVAALCPNNTNRILTVLACSGRVLRVLEHCRVRQTVELESVPTTLHVPKGLGDKVICGFTDGRVILYRIGLYATEIKQEILVAEKDSNAVTCLTTFDITDDGKEELIVGRRDGTIQVFTTPSDSPDEIDTECQQVYREIFNESISSVQGGCVANVGYNEIVVCTYTGRIFALTTRCIGVSLGDPVTMNALNLNDPNAKILRIKNEIEELEAKVIKERERYQMSTQTFSTGLSAIPMLLINDAMHLSPEDATYNLSIEIPASIESVLLQSDFPIDLLDVDCNAAVVSLSEADSLSGNYLLATYRCQVNTNRVDLKFRVIEGQHGTLRAYITPVLQPKVCQLKKYSVKPLSMHIRCHSISEKRPMNSLTLKGSFSLAEIHNWVGICVPEVPEKHQSGQLYFENVFTKTVLCCDYKKGEATFQSDNLTTISILKDIVTKEATKKRIKLEISSEVNDASIGHMIKLIEPTLIGYLKRWNEYKLLEALIDINLRSDDEKMLLSDEFKDILDRQTTIVSNFKKDPNILDRVFGIITDLYIDRFKFKGINVKQQIPKLIALLTNYNWNEVIAFFAGEKNQDHNIDTV